MKRLLLIIGLYLFLPAVLDGLGISFISNQVNVLAQSCANPGQSCENIPCCNSDRTYCQGASGSRKCEQDGETKNSHCPDSSCGKINGYRCAAPFASECHESLQANFPTWENAASYVSGCGQIDEVCWGGSNIDHLCGDFEIFKSSCQSPTPVCPFDSTQAQVQRSASDPWNDAKTITLGESVYLGGFHNGTGFFAGDKTNNTYTPNEKDVDFFLVDPVSGAEIVKQPNTNYPIVYTPKKIGVYNYQGKTRIDPQDPTQGYFSELACTDLGKIKVSPVPTPPALSFTQECSEAQLSWTAVKNTNDYHLERCTGASCSNFTALATVASTSTTYRDSGLVSTKAYNYRVKGHFHNNPDSSTAWSNTVTARPVCPSPSPSPSGTIRVRIVRVEPQSDPNSCTITQSGNLPGASPNLELKGPTAASGTVGTDYSYFEDLNFGTYTLSFNSLPSGYSVRQACAANSLTSPGLNPDLDLRRTLGSNGTTWDLGLSTAAGWFQVRGGNIHSNNNIFVSVPDGKNFMLSEEPDSVPKPLSAGIVSFASSAQGLALVPGVGYLVEESRSHKKFVENGDYYNYFSGKFPTKLTLTDTSDDLLPAPGTYLRNGNLTLNGVTPWTVTRGTTVVIFVNGDLTIQNSSKKIRVEEPNATTYGGFLAFIVSGNISIHGSIGHTISEIPATPNRYLDADISGVYITNGEFRTETNSGSNDRQVIFAGTFVASSFRLQRDLGTNNTTNPGELFIYRPDFWLSAPREFSSQLLRWEEVNP